MLVRFVASSVIYRMSFLQQIPGALPREILYFLYDGSACAKGGSDSKRLLGSTAYLCALRDVPFTYFIQPNSFAMLANLLYFHG